MSGLAGLRSYEIRAAMITKADLRTRRERIATALLSGRAPKSEWPPSETALKVMETLKVVDELIKQIDAEEL